MSESGRVEFEEEVEVEEIDDNIEEAVTAFTTSTKPLYKSPAPSYETPEPKSESSQPRSHTTSSSSVQKTVIKAEVEEPPSPRQQEVEAEEDEDEDEDSEWDSEVSLFLFLLILAMLNKLTLVLLNPVIPCLCKQCSSRSVGF